MRQGLFDGFEAYRNPGPTDFKAVLEQGMVVLDTNVLLDLYRMNARVREDMLAVLKAVEQRLWVPHQVLVEFWRNRHGEELLTYHHKKAEAAKKTLDDAYHKAERAIEDWAKNVHIREVSESVAPLELRLSEARAAFNGLQELLRAQADRDTVPGIRDTNTDPVIGELESLLAGRVGEAYDAERHVAEIALAKGRAAERIPPGFKDFEDGKSDGEAAGDYLVWRQLLDEVSVRNSDVLFVTRDLKEDWWRPGNPQLARLPHVRLVEELRDVTGRRLLMAEPSVLMQQVDRVFTLPKEVDSNSVAALQHFEIEESESKALRQAGAGARYRLAQVPGGRSGDYVEIILLMAQLVEESGQLASCIAKFIKEFPSVTLESEARRRLLNLVSLGLAVVQGDSIALTSAGLRFVETCDAELLCRLFMERIEGAFEARNLLREGADAANLRDLLIALPGLELSGTQSDLVVRWMGKLGLLAA
ncbi:PIN-like domain-containing protein [Streptomyces sp. CBMA156]|uniref:PIN-like domain-containing protein n=1 Tax=Streptomyces sp. CBMA156 TaxID=1930280 RepID=UPI001661BF68|nr:PIN-like domain-containing protein [Streptomyces sp. CBMA156]